MPTAIDVLGALLVFVLAAGAYAVLYRSINGARGGRTCPKCLQPASSGDQRPCRPSADGDPTGPAPAADPA